MTSPYENTEYKIEPDAIDTYTGPEALARAMKLGVKVRRRTWRDSALHLLWHAGSGTYEWGNKPFRLNEPQISKFVCDSESEWQDYAEPEPRPQWRLRDDLTFATSLAGYTVTNSNGSYRHFHEDDFTFLFEGIDK